jgi:hypothetical protein
MLLSQKKVSYKIWRLFVLDQINMPTGRKDPGQMVDTVFANDFGLQLQHRLCKMFQQTSARSMMGGITSLFSEKEQ